MWEWLKEVLCWHKWTEWCYFDEFKVRTCIKCFKEEWVEEDDSIGKNTDKARVNCRCWDF